MLIRCASTLHVLLPVHACSVDLLDIESRTLISLLTMAADGRTDGGVIVAAVAGR